MGATLTINDANTSTPTAIFSDAALTVPLVNPVAGASASDAGGWFPQIFAAEGAAVDITLKNSAGTTVQTYVDVTFVGADTGEFERTLADSTRFKVRGSGSVVYIEFGDPSPDNTGGTAVIGGWAGTQADLLTVNSALFNVIGRIKENSKKLGGTVYTEATTFTAASVVDIPLTADPAGVLAWDIDVWDFRMSAALANARALLSYDNGLTFKTGASDYFGNWVHSENAAIVVVADAAVAAMDLASNFQGSATRMGVMSIRVITPASGSTPTRVLSQADGLTSNPYVHSARGNWFGEGGYGKATHIRLLGASGTITGKYRVMPLRGFGEA